MRFQLFKRLLFTSAIWSSIELQSPCATQYETTQYISPYSVKFTIAPSDLLAPDAVTPRDNHRNESKTPHEQWYSSETLRRFHAWGPEARGYPAVENYNSAPLEWKRQRLIAVACKYIGLPYQHHHIPNWNPPANWPWKRVAFGRNSNGLDCSNFSTWVYNYGLGISLKTGVREQAFATTVQGSSGIGTLLVMSIPKIKSNNSANGSNNNYSTLVKALRPGDLLYIKGRTDGGITHVIMWLGEYGVSPDNTPLVIDCTGKGHFDCNRVAIPVGVRIRPFTPTSWYYKSFDHANRILAEDF